MPVKRYFEDSNREKGLRKSKKMLTGGQAKLDKNKNISGLSFEGEGCAISLASASILTDTLKGKDLQFSKKVTDDFLNMLKNKSKITLNSLSEDQITTISSLSGVQEFPMRIKCATMAWHTLLSALEKKGSK